MNESIWGKIRVDLRVKLGILVIDQNMVDTWSIWVDDTHLILWIFNLINQFTYDLINQSFNLSEILKFIQNLINLSSI